MHNLKGSGDDNNLLETVLELSKMAKGMLEQDKKLEELEDNGHNTTDVLTSRLMIEYVIKDYCFWVSLSLILLRERERERGVETVKENVSEDEWQV